MVTTQRRSQPRLGQRGESCGVYKRTGKVPRQRTKVLPCCNFGFPLPHSSSPCIFTNTFLSLLFYKIYLIKDVDTTFRLTVGYYLFLLNLTQGPKTRRLSFYPFLFYHILHWICFKIPLTESLLHYLQFPNVWFLVLTQHLRLLFQPWHNQGFIQPS